MAALLADVNSVHGHRDGIRWDLYPRVGAVPPACAFVIRLYRFCRRPKTVDAYARNLERFLAWFEDPTAEGWIEADVRATSSPISMTCATGEYLESVLG